MLRYVTLDFLIYVVHTFDYIIEALLTLSLLYDSFDISLRVKQRTQKRPQLSVLADMPQC